MCGIVGWLGDREAARQLDLGRGVAALRHRGPDAQATAVIPGDQVICALGHTRLAVIDLSPGGAQPMRTDDGRFTLVFNGEIYNFMALRAELEAGGYRFKSRSDTEVLLQALAAWGPSACTRLRGMFAFALFDRLEETLLLARDRLGIKPLYVARRGALIAFASEVRALIAARAVAPRLDPEAVAGLLATGSVPEPRTILEGVEMLAPGSWLRAGRTGVVREDYWELPGTDCRSIATAGEAVEAVGAELRAAIGMRLVADVPLGVFVSGGIDSSVVLAMAAEQSAKPVTAITVELEDARLDESRFARTVAQQYGARQLRVPLSAGRAATSIDEAVSALDQPSSDGLNSYFVSRATREAGITVALSGLGGDELFAGYSHFRTFRTVMRWRGALQPLARQLPAIGGGPFASRGQWAKGRELLASVGSAGQTYNVLRAMFLPEQVSALMPGRLARESAFDASGPPLSERLVEADPVNAYSRLELARYLRNTLLRDTDVMSMASALEVRVPIIDHKVVELALAIPGQLKVGGRINKPILAATVPSLPSGTVGRPKQGFALPFDSWFRGTLRGWIEERLLGEPTRRLGIVEPGAVEAAWRAFLRGEQFVSHSRVWTLAVLADWCQRHGVSS
jgi:asparagine synthase (glutamine-hydrolysing)